MLIAQLRAAEHRRDDVQIAAALEALRRDRQPSDVAPSDVEDDGATRVGSVARAALEPPTTTTLDRDGDEDSDANEDF